MSASNAISKVYNIMYMALHLALFIYIIGLTSFALSQSIAGSPRTDSIIISLLKNNLLHDEYQGDAELGKKFCKAFSGSGCYAVSNFGQGICSAGGGSGCYAVRSIGQGICSAGGGSGCYAVRSIGQGICSAGGGSGCYAVRSIGQGICSAGGGSGCYAVRSISEGFARIPKGDRDWDWDQFYHSTGSLVWACRGIQTGQFAEQTRCAGKPKNDYRWPNK